MVLVDTSVWIEVFRRPQRLRLESVVDFDHNLTVLHNDRDYPALAKVSGLQQRQIPRR